MKDTRLHIDAIRRLLRRHAKGNLEKVLTKLHPADIALIFRHLNEDERAQVFLIIPTVEQAAQVLSELDDSIIEEILPDLPMEKILLLMKELSADDEVAILRLLPEELSDKILTQLKGKESEEMEALMAYKEDSAGALMTTEVFALHEDLSVKDAISSIQTQVNQEMVFYLYVIDDHRRLVGVISLRDLITSKPGNLLSNIMTTRVHSVDTDMNQEEVAHVVSRYNILAVPVVDEAHTLLGIITVDDVIDVIREEATEDFLQMAGAGRDKEIISKNVFDNVKLRIPWLFASWIGGLLVASIISKYETTLGQVLALVAFLPIITGMAGNVGTQTSTIIVRGIATGRVTHQDSLATVFKEFRVGIILGLLYGLLLGGAGYLVGSLEIMDLGVMTPEQLGITVGSGIFSAMTIATTIGAFIPIVLEKLNQDPAIATGPFVTTAIDIAGVFVYFVIASFFIF